MCSAQYHYFVSGASRERRFMEMAIFTRMPTRKHVITRAAVKSNIEEAIWKAEGESVCSRYEKKSSHLWEGQCFGLIQGPGFNGRFSSILLTAAEVISKQWRSEEKIHTVVGWVTVTRPLLYKWPLFLIRTRINIRNRQEKKKIYMYIVEWFYPLIFFTLSNII